MQILDLVLILEVKDKFTDFIELNTGEARDLHVTSLVNMTKMLKCVDLTQATITLNII